MKKFALIAFGAAFAAFPAIAEVTPATPNEVITFDAIDANGDSVITQVEFNESAKSKVANFSEIDVNADGEITKLEYDTFTGTKDALDDNGDDGASSAE